MRGFRSLVAIAVAVLLTNAPALAQSLTAFARVDAGASSLRDVGRDVELVLRLSQPVPYRVFTLDSPRRLVLDFSEVNWDGLQPEVFDRSRAVTAMAVGVFRPGWSRMVLELAQPLGIGTVDMATSDGAVVTVRLTPLTTAEFTARAGAPESALFKLPVPAPLDAPHQRQTGDRPVVIALDPGHGGIDPGAERDGAVEADLMLGFARELRDTLMRAGNFEVVLTRDADVFVPLELRQSMARAKGADVFISLHADALAEGRASGATIYTLSDTASDAASEKLAERHDRGDLLAGLDLSAQDDVIAGVLMDMARIETAPRSDRLAEALVLGLDQTIGTLHKRPRLEASFSVLKAADIPSVLIELGFLSNTRDLENLQSPEWRAAAAEGIRDALRIWAAADAAEAGLLRQ